MQKWSGKLRPFANFSMENLSYISPSNRFFYSSPHLQNPVLFTVNKSIFKLTSVLSVKTEFQLLGLGFRPSLLFMNQRRGFASKKKEKKRSPVTPVTSKLKKTKMKSYASYKSRFRTMRDGQIRRWREGKRHNAHLKSKKSKRRLRKPALVPPAYAKVMKKLNFCG
ncbi:ribosomal protein L35 [Tasmannia lanceolata]|uniref:ribosomal protein L35 n=1 Tax=Tasmannia lanceolata TaxID=3420 RepID=UPI00406382D7